MLLSPVYASSGSLDLPLLSALRHMQQSVAPLQTAFAALAPQLYVGTHSPHLQLGAVLLQFADAEARFRLQAVLQQQVDTAQPSVGRQYAEVRSNGGNPGAIMLGTDQSRRRSMEAICCDCPPSPDRSNIRLQPRVNTTAVTTNALGASSFD